MTKDDIAQIVKEQATAIVDYDLLGNPINQADVLLMSAFGPLIERIAIAVAKSTREECAKVCDRVAAILPKRAEGRDVSEEQIAAAVCMAEELAFEIRNFKKMTS